MFQPSKIGSASHASHSQDNAEAALGRTERMNHIAPRQGAEFEQVRLRPTTEADLDLERDRGYGRQAIRLIKALAFVRWQAERLWLTVRTHNARAQHLYESEGFITEGFLAGGEPADASTATMWVMAIHRPPTRAQLP
jgi:hypothetical protein